MKVINTRNIWGYLYLIYRQSIHVEIQNHGVLLYISSQLHIQWRHSGPLKGAIYEYSRRGNQQTL